MSGLTHNLAGTARDVTWTYTRNQVGEIARRTWSNDLYQWADVANGTQAYSVNGLNQYTQVAGTTLSYDANANLTGDGTWTYGYDLDNRLRSAAKTGLSATLAYDAEGRLRQTAIAGTTTNLAYDGTDLIAEYDSAGTLLRRYVHGPGIDEPLVVYEGSGATSKTWLYADHLGSIVAQANAAGTGTATYRYGPFGEPDGTTGQRFRYTGQQLIGALGLYHYKARFYSPSLGRFLQTDPIGYGDGLNLYAYVGNDPIAFVDPLGLAAHSGGGGGWDIVRGVGIGIVDQALEGAWYSAPNPLLESAFPGEDFSPAGQTGLAYQSPFPTSSTIEENFGRDLASAVALVAVLVTKRPLLGHNPKIKKDRTLTDLDPVHDRATAKSIFRNQSKGQNVRQFQNKKGDIIRRADDGTQIRMNPDGSTRLDLPGRGTQPNGETIHFNP